MQKISVTKVRRTLGRLLDEVQAGEEVIILRRGKPVARLTQVESLPKEGLRFPDRSSFRAALQRANVTGATLVRELRDERG